MKNSPDPAGQGSQPKETDTSVDQERRDALAKIGLYAAYTAPLLLGMVTGAQAHGASPGNGGPD
jgi:hypothetical protein